MGLIKFLLIFFTCILVGLFGGMFIVRNDMEIPVQTLLTASPMQLSVGQLSAYSFILGLFLGVVLCVAYLLIQFIELKALKRKTSSQEKQMASLRSSSFKDAS